MHITWARVCHRTTVLLTGAFLLLSTSAHAQHTRLEMYIGGGQNRGSDDGGLTWSDGTVVNPTMWHSIPTRFNPTGERLSISQVPAVVSDAPGHLILANFTSNRLVWTRYTSWNNQWFGWDLVPGTSNSGEVWVAGRRYLLRSQPALSSWGPGRLEVFVNAAPADNPTSRALVHTWADNLTFTNRGWEVLGTGVMQDNPTAISWGQGRTDVFMRGGGNELVHKSYANGRWSGWEDLGGCITFSPSVVSMQPGHLDVYARGCDAALWHQWFTANNWSGWEYLGGVLKDWPWGPPSAASRGPGNVDVFVFGSDGVMYQKTYNWGWSDFRPVDLLWGVSTFRVGVVYWTP